MNSLQKIFSFARALSIMLFLQGCGGGSAAVDRQMDPQSNSIDLPIIFKSSGKSLRSWCNSAATALCKNHPFDLLESSAFIAPQFSTPIKYIDNTWATDIEIPVAGNAYIQDKTRRITGVNHDWNPTQDGPLEIPIYFPNIGEFSVKLEATASSTPIYLNVNEETRGILVDHSTSSSAIFTIKNPGYHTIRLSSSASNTIELRNIHIGGPALSMNPAAPNIFGTTFAREEHTTSNSPSVYLDHEFDTRLSDQAEIYIYAESTTTHTASAHAILFPIYMRDVYIGSGLSQTGEIDLIFGSPPSEPGKNYSLTYKNPASTHTETSPEQSAITLKLSQPNPNKKTTIYYLIKINKDQYRTEFSGYARIGSNDIWQHMGVFEKPTSSNPTEDDTPSISSIFENIGDVNSANFAELNSLAILKSNQIITPKQTNVYSNKVGLLQDRIDFRATPTQSGIELKFGDYNLQQTNDTLSNPFNKANILSTNFELPTFAKINEPLPWSSDAMYNKTARVIYNSTSWQATAFNTNSPPAIDNRNWHPYK